MKVLARTRAWWWDLHTQVAWTIYGTPTLAWFAVGLVSAGVAVWVPDPISTVLTCVTLLAAVAASSMFGSYLGYRRCQDDHTRTVRRR